MTFRQLLTALWRRKWIVVAVTVIAGLVAVLYLSRLTPSYMSSTTVRASPSMTQASYAGELAGIPIDADFSIITSAVILDPAAEALGLPAGSLAGSVTYEVPQTAVAALPIVISATASEPELAQQIATAVGDSLGLYLDAQVASVIATLQERLATATSQAVDFQGQVLANPLDAIAANNLTQALSDMSAINTQISAAESIGQALTVLTPASLGSSTNPSVLIVAALALLCGLIAGAGLAILRDHFDDRIVPGDDLEKLTGLPTIALLAKDRGVSRGTTPLPAGTVTRTALSEGLRSLRTSLQVLLPEGKGVVVITSVEPGDGKTFVSANVALSWARAGRKVILIGGDLRRPELGKYFTAANEGPGLAGLLADGSDGERPPNQAQITAALRPTPFRGLRILPAGEGAMDPADLLAGPMLGRIVRYLARNADIVVIDSPPALALADASELAAFADGVVVLATVNRVKRSLLVESVRGLQSNGANILGIIVNRARVRLPKSYGSYYLNPSRGEGEQRAAAADNRAFVEDDLDEELGEPLAVGDLDDSVRPSRLPGAGPRRAVNGQRADSPDAFDDDHSLDDDLDDLLSPDSAIAIDEAEEMDDASDAADSDYGDTGYGDTGYDGSDYDDPEYRESESQRNESA